MRNSLVVLAWVFVFVFVVSPVWSDSVRWWVVNTHPHSNHSDGRHSMMEVAEACAGNGAEAVIISDHAEMINKDQVFLDAYPKGPASALNRILIPHREPGVESWIQHLKGDTPIPLVPGMECGLGEGYSSHLLYWGGMPESYRTIVAIAETANHRPDEAAHSLILCAKANGAVLVQAHPFNQHYPFAVDVPFVEGVTYGIEFFNGTWETQYPCFERMVRMQAHTNRPVIATGGTDWHGDLYEVTATLAQVINPGLAVKTVPDMAGDFHPQLYRRTVIGATGRSSDELMRGLRAGRCYAAFDPALNRPSRITFASALPGEKFQLSADNYKFKMSVSGLFDADRVFVGVMGRDGRGRLAPSTDPGSGITHRGGEIEIDLTRFCSRLTNCGWWLFVMTPRVVTSAIEILPFERQIAEEPLVLPPTIPTIPAATPTPTPVPPIPTPTPPISPVQTEQDPMTLISGYPFRYYGQEDLKEGCYISVWAGMSLYTYERSPADPEGLGGKGVVVVDVRDDRQIQRRVVSVDLTHFSQLLPLVRTDNFIMSAIVRGRPKEYKSLTMGVSALPASERATVVIWSGGFGTEVRIRRID